jgi:uncharacterized protein
MLRKIAILEIVCALALAAADTRVSDAAMRGDRAIVRLLLEQKADVNGQQPDGTTALHWAAFHDDLELANLLIASGAEVKIVTRDEKITPLLLAAQNGSAAMTKALLEAGADPNSANALGTTVLMFAAASGDANTVKLLLDRGAKINAQESARGQSALFFAAALNRAEVIKLLLARGADPKIATKVAKMERVRVDADGNPLPADAPEGRGNEKTQAEGTTPDRGGRGGKAGDVTASGPRSVGASTMGGMTALLLASRDGHKNAVAALLDGGTPINQVGEGDQTSPLIVAILNGRYDLAKYLLERGADPNLPNSYGLGALYATVDVQWAPHAWYPQPNTTQEQTTYLELMAVLLKHGANPNVRLAKKLWFRGPSQDPTWVDPIGSTAFWRAAQSADVAAMRLLKENGADPNLASAQNATPLLVASGIGWMANHSANVPGGWLDAVRYCVEIGADVNAVDNRGYTALHGAAYLGENEVVKFLVSKGAKINAKSKAGDTVADMANGPTRFGLPHADTVALLESLGSANSHNCRSDQCLVAPKEEKPKEEKKPAPAASPKGN